MSEEMNAAEALYGFMGWLTTRERVTPEFSLRHEAGEAARLVEEFCKKNKLTEPRDGWQHNLKHPGKE